MKTHKSILLLTLCLWILLTSGCEFTRTDTQLTFFPVVDDGFSLEVKYFYDGTIAFLNESYVK